MGRKKRKIKLSEMADSMLNANVHSNYSKLFFLNSHCRRRPIDVFDERLVTWRVESQLSLEAKRLTCKYCDRVFHKRFVVCDYQLILIICFLTVLMHTAFYGLLFTAAYHLPSLGNRNPLPGFRFGLSRHVKATHNEVLRELADRIKTTSDHRYKMDVCSSFASFKYDL